MKQARAASAERAGSSRGLSRRACSQALLLTAGSLVAGAGLLPGRPAGAASRTYLSTFGQQRYFTYPTQNAFLDNGRKVVLGEIGRAGRSSLWLHDIRTGASRKIADFALPGRRNFIYYDVAENAPVLAVSDTTALWTVDLGRAAPTLRRLYTPPRGNSLDDIVSIRPDATTVLAACRLAGANHPTTVVRVRDGWATPLFTKNFRANHLQYAPNDPSWFGFARDQGNIRRVWGHHSVVAPQGKLLWNQRSPNGGDLRVGHEVWCRHDLSILVVAYRSSPGSPRGLYEVRPDGSSRLVQAANDYLHCNIRRDGRFAVVDTITGGVVLIDMTGKAAPRQLVHTRIAPHPRQPHPHFTPDGTRVVYTDTNASNQVRVTMVSIG